MITCPNCRSTHENACGSRVFARASCPVCLETREPVVALPCGHALCEPCFGRLPGADRAGKPDSFGMIAFVSNLLLESHRLLTPEQARGLWRAVEPMVLDIHDFKDRSARSKFIMLLASFLSSPERWCRIPPHARNEFWPDEADGCAWWRGSGATPANLLEVRTSLPGDMRRRDPERLPPLEK